MTSLRPIALTDAPAIAAAVGSSRAALRRWMPWYRDDYDVHAAEDWICYALSSVATGTAAHFAIIGPDDHVVGVISFEGIGEIPVRAMLGYWLATPVSGRGIGRRAIAHALDWAREHSTIQIAWAIVAEQNEPSRRVLEANGLRVAGARGVDERGDTQLIYELNLRAACRSQRFGSRSAREGP